MIQKLNPAGQWENMQNKAKMAALHVNNVFGAGKELVVHMKKNMFYSWLGMHAS